MYYSCWFWLLGDEPSSESDSGETTAAESAAATASPEPSGEPVPGDENISLIVDTTQLIEARIEHIQVAAFSTVILLAFVAVWLVLSALWRSI